MGLDERSRGSLPVSSPHEASGSLGEGSAPPHPPTPGASFEESSVARMETSSAGAAMEASSQSPSPPRAAGTSSSVAAGCRAPSENSPFGGSARAPAVLGALPSSPLPGAAAAAPATDLPDLASACPPYGSKSIIGRRSKMEDACIAIPALVRLPLDRGLPDEILPPRIASHLRSALGAEDAGHGRSASGSEVGRGGAGGGGAASRARSSPEASLELRTASGSAASTSRGGGSPAGPRRRGAGCPPAGVDTLHFFGVFDGHGGADAAVHCAQVLHLHVRALLEALADPEAGAEAGFEGLESGPGVGASASSMDASGLLAAEALAAEALAGGAPPRCSSGAPLSLAALLPRASSEAVEAALTRAFYAADEEFGRLGGYEHLALVGTTAVVALVGSRALYVANCGDSRAVLCRGGVALPLTDDHKAAREDETARVEAAGGQILFWNGVRVMGLLAVSRAVGDHSLRPYVIAQPEVTIVARHEADELLVLASDGLWDVMSNQEACTLAKKCLQRARARGSSRQSAARVAATVLTRAAVDRGSRDNVTVVIVDMTPGAAVDEDLAARAASGLVGLPPGEVAPLAGGAASPVASAPSLETRPLEGQRVESKGAAPLSPFDSVAREPPVRRVEMAVPPLGSPFSSGVLVPES